jgi:hypothetical protein
MENQERNNEEWKIKIGAMTNGKSREEKCSSLDFPFFIAPLLIFHSSLLLS